MTDLTARCLNTTAPCTGFEVICHSEQHKTRVEQAHMTRHHDGTPTTDEMCDRIWTERGDDCAKVVQAIEAVARLNNNEVDWNVVRSLIDGEVSSGAPGAVASVLQRQGRLEFLREVQSTDRKSRNTNKKSKVYRLLPADDRSVTA